MNLRNREHKQKRKTIHTNTPQQKSKRKVEEKQTNKQAKEKKIYAELLLRLNFCTRQ